MRRAPAFVLGAAALVRSAAGLWLGFRPFDDTYITFRYSSNLAAGYGFVYNVGEPVLGTTAPLWALVLALATALGVPIEHAALVISLASDSASAFLLFSILSGLGFGGVVPVAGALIFLGIFDFFSLARSGMESSFFVCLVLASLRSVVLRRVPTAAVFAALGALTRPEGTLLLATSSWALWHYWKDLSWREVTAAVMLFCGIAGAWAVYAVRTFGSVVPQSVVAKAALSDDPMLAQFSWNNVGLFFLRGQSGDEIFTRTYLQLMPVVSALAAAGAMALVWCFVHSRSRDTRLRVVVLLFFPAAYVAGMALSHAFTYFPWYYAPIYPFMAALVPIGTAFVIGPNKVAVAGITGLLVAVQLVAGAAVKSPADTTRFWVQGYFDVSSGVPRDPSVRVAAPEIGAIGWRVRPSTIIDLEGLVTPEAVGTAPAELLKERLPEYLIVRTDNAAGLLKTLQREEWFERAYEVTAVRKDPHGSREFRAYQRRR